MTDSLLDYYWDGRAFYATSIKDGTSLDLPGDQAFKVLGPQVERPPLLLQVLVTIVDLCRDAALGGVQHAGDVQTRHPELRHVGGGGSSQIVRSYVRDPELL